MIYGHYYKTLRRGPLLENETCPDCNTKGKTQFEVICKVNHLMFIPALPTGKEVVVRCAVCSKRYHSIVYPHLQNESTKLLKITRYRFYHYTALMLFAAFAAMMVVLVVTGDIEKREQIAEQIENMSRGKVINYKLDNGEKTSMYVEEVKGDTLFVFENKYSTTGSVYHINETENFSKNKTVFTVTKLKELADRKKIIDIYTSASYTIQELLKEHENEDI